MKAIFTVAALLCVAAALTDAAHPKWHQLEGYTFDQYIDDFGRPWEKGTAEYAKRELVFNEKMFNIKQHNADKTMTWKKGVNQFTDMTAQEWKNFNRFKKSNKRPTPMKVTDAGDDFMAPKEVDYRTWNSPRVLTAVKHQGSCGNCWAQSATESVEAYYALATNMLPVLSTQQITSCDMFSYGCGGGDYATGWNYVNGTDGLTEEWAYPFENFFFNISDPNAQTQACKNITKEYPAKPYSWFAELNMGGVLGVGSVTQNSARSTMKHLAEQGPLSISVAAGNWQDYETGVMSNTNSSGGAAEWQVDHAVQMVGYGHDKELGMDYWIVRNSWSTLWGEDGFVRLNRPAVEPCAPAMYGGDTVCGTSGCLNDPQWPIVTKNKPRKF